MDKITPPDGSGNTTPPSAEKPVVCAVRPTRDPDSKLSPDFQAAVDRMMGIPITRPTEKSYQEQREERRRRECLSQFERSVGPRLAGARLGNYRCDHPGQQAALDAIQAYGDNLRHEVASDNGIILFGGCGTGKDHLLTALARVAIVRHGLSVRYAFGVNLFSELRDRIGEHKSEEDWLDDLTSPKILILSDPVPPRGELTGYQASMLQAVVDDRYRYMQPTWVSMNVTTSAEADSLLGPALVDRLTDGALTLRFDWPSFRKARA